MRDGRVVATETDVRLERGIHAIDLSRTLRLERSAWVAARGDGSAETIPDGAEIAHTAAIRVIVGGQPIWSDSDAEALLAELAAQRDYYERNARYASEEHRQRMTTLFEQASAELRDRPGSGSRSELAACAGP